MNEYYERRYCDDCLTVHWLEITPLNREICHGVSFSPVRETRTHYARRTGKGFTRLEKATARAPRKLPPEWEILRQAPLFEAES
jgi:hypothetical protein